MRVLYLLVDDLDPDAAELERLSSAGQALLAPGDTFTVEPIAFGPAEYYESALGFALCVPGIVHAVLNRQADHDAIVIGCFGDPGLRAARTVATIPVIGACEASVSFALLVAQRFGIVTIMGSDIPEIDARLAEMELAHRCVGVAAIERPFYTVMDDPADTLDRLERAARPLVERGAQAIVLGCLSYGFAAFESELAERLDRPVLNPLRASIAAASGLRLLGVGPSPAWVAPAGEAAAAAVHLAELSQAAAG
jgi:allantoin racemase